MSSTWCRVRLILRTAGDFCQFLGFSGPRLLKQFQDSFFVFFQVPILKCFQQISTGAFLGMIIHVSSTVWSFVKATCSIGCSERDTGL